MQDSVDNKIVINELILVKSPHYNYLHDKYEILISAQVFIRNIYNYNIYCL